MTKKTTTNTPGKKSPRASQKKSAAAEKTAHSRKTFPIVGLGASAGGLEALKEFFSQVPEDSGLAYVVVVHMTPHQPSMLAELLQRGTKIPIESAIDGETIQPDHAYVIPPDKEISVYNGTLQLLDTTSRTNHLPIDFFFKSLAQDQKTNAVGIVLSGMGTDGTLGLKEIKLCEGLTLVQSETTAKYSNMPRSAIATGIIDMVAAPKAMPKKIMHYFKNQGSAAVAITTATPPTTKSPEEIQQNWLPKIFALLRNQTSHDFSSYKMNTILRRIARRMGLNNITDHQTYIRLLQENAKEVESLFRELLIGVTNFFRDAQSFEKMKKKIFPNMLEQMANDTIFRVWVPGCSTGEEVYSLAIILQECLDTTQKRITFQLFGTDIDKYAIEKAREGLFPANIGADVSEERLNRFFTMEGDYYRIRKELRNNVVFSVQNVIKDPPFSRLNLLCCRNLLIYLNSEAQKKLLPLFHYTLISGGILVLGASETIGGFTNLFEPIDNKWKIFRARDIPPLLRGQIDFPTGSSADSTRNSVDPTPLQEQKVNINHLIKDIILHQFSPPAILTDSKGNILYVQGRTGKYLETISGPPTNNIVDMAREGLRIELSSSIRTAATSREKVVRKEIRIKTEGGIQLINLHVCPFEKPKEFSNKLLIVFEDIPVVAESEDSIRPTKNLSQNWQDTRINDLEKELQQNQESYQTIIEELESSNEELKSTNEELQSSNEELQSTNEELESSKEELQSLNEELQTVNSELQGKVEELSNAHDDMRNLLNSIEVATLFVDNQLRIKRFTAEATKIINLIQTDIGRPLQHVVSNLEYSDMIKNLIQVIETLTPKVIEVKSKQGDWYLMRIIPYRTADNRIDGAVLTFTEINNQKKALAILESRNIETETLLRNLFDMNTSPLAVLDNNGTLVIANNQFYELMHIDSSQMNVCDVFNLKEGILCHTDLKKKLEHAVSNNENFITTSFQIETRGKKKHYVINGQIVRQNPTNPYRVLLQLIEKVTIHDSTPEKKATSKRKK